MDRKGTTRYWLAVLAGGMVLAGFVWASDAVTPNGERTIYTVACEQGAWQGSVCTGRLVSAERYRYRALTARGEVLFWTLGAHEPSSKFTNCKIEDGRNWACPPNADAPKSITLAMAHGVALHDPTGQVRSFHAVPKWRWILAGYGVPVGNDAAL